MTPTAAELARENEELRQQLREAEELIEAVRTGAVDALAIQGAEGPRIFTLESADHGYRTLVEQMSEGAVLLAADGFVLYCNAALAQGLGCAQADMLGHSFTEFVPAQYLAYWLGLCQQGWLRQVRGEMPLQSCHDGSLHPFSVSMNVLTFSGAPTLAVLLADVSARKEISAIRSMVVQQNALLDRKNEELLRQQAARVAIEKTAAEVGRMLEGIPQIAWTADLQGRTTYLNQRWFDYVGENATTPEQLASRIHPDDFAVSFRSWEHSLATQQPLELECRIRNQTGDYRWMLGRALPSRNEAGEVVQWIGTYTDIHAHKLAQERVAQAQRLLRDNNEELTRVNVDLDSFIYTASHDLKGPITNIEGLLQALTDELPVEARLRPPVNDIMGMLTKSVTRFQRTIEQLGDVAKLQREHGLAVVPVPLSSVVQGVSLDLAPLVRASGAQLDVELADNAAVRFLEKNLRSLVYNLLSNALKYRDPARPARVQLRARPDGQFMRLTVQDNGLGIDPAGQRKLFGLFERLHNHVEGSGIGLFMVKKMVENAGGRIAVESEVGVGSTFTVLLPQ
ncbi:PAS domain-containing sensor histidine kinase [Hymenobacter sp. H14-R3]|uniref:PAS domain-containing sensor histidine kinase n=1 Tax=Hymenobacter sp. H14-R3 TaxID=3046308 RepID=UPI0024BBBB6A|nr:PAS domain-containing sensor histidine kinase [Hymenobacter sp. H14-R3]MDJ0364627.1 PAS domain-containing sensor histidine kinase [Hymenobacter sp. H14-R3]